MKNTDSKAITLKIPGSDKDVNLAAYLVDNNGNLIESAPFDRDTATLQQSRSTIQGQYRIYVAQVFPKDYKKEVNEVALVNAGAYQVVQNFSGNEIRIGHLPGIIYDPWLFDFCEIEGNITNTLTVNGTDTTSPVCNARVHIEQVETRLRFPWWPIWYERIPDWVIDEIRTQLLKAVPEGKKRQISSPIPGAVMDGIRSTSRDTVLQTLVDNHELFRPYFCWWPWCWPWFYYTTSDTIVYTDCNGNFNWWEIFLEGGSANIYVWVEVLIDGSWTTVYRPFLPCGTHWAYQCGSPINISLDNPYIPPCGCEAVIPGAYVQMDSVNGGANIRGIQQSPTASGHLANAVGLTAYRSYGNISPFGSSFTFRLYFGAGLQGAIFNGNTVTHYRWSYTRITDPYLNPVSDSVHYLNPAISKPYWYYTAEPGGGFERFDKAFPLGPIVLDPANNPVSPMYKIPHGIPDQDDPTLPADAQGFPYTDSIQVATANNLPDGLYEFTFELVDDYGNVVPIPKVDCPFLVEALPGDVNPDDATAINADGLSANGYAEDYVIHDGSGNVIGFNFQMRIDNSSCYAGISDAIIAGQTTDTECGTGTYENLTDPVELLFQAGHPHNFATYSFNVYKGNSGLVPPTGSVNPNSSGTSANQNGPGPIPGMPPLVTMGNNNYSITQVSTINSPAVPATSTTPAVPENPENWVSNMDQYQQTMPVGDLLGSCTTAAFSENLYVAATHTDGVNRLSEYDAQWVAAIAISPELVPAS